MVMGMLVTSGSTSLIRMLDFYERDFSDKLCCVFTTDNVSQTDFFQKQAKAMNGQCLPE